MVTLVEGTGHGPVTRAQRAGLLQRRMVSLGLAQELIADREPEMLEHLRISCATCECPSQCESDLREASAAPGWEDYCPNAVLLNALAELCWFRSTPTVPAD